MGAYAVSFPGGFENRAVTSAILHLPPGIGCRPTQVCSIGDKCKFSNGNTMQTQVKCMLWYYFHCIAYGLITGSTEFTDLLYTANASFLRHTALLLKLV